MDRLLTNPSSLAAIWRCGRLSLEIQTRTASLLLLLRMPLIASA